MLAENFKPAGPNQETTDEDRRSVEQGTLSTANCELSTDSHGGLAQLARAPALQAGGHRFESDILHFFGIV